MSRTEVLALLREAAPGILPSMLLCDFGRLCDEVRRLEAAGLPALHLDVMDGHFVNNLTYGLPLVETFRRLSDLPLDVHLMISNPEECVASYIEAGADVVTVHHEAAREPLDLLRAIQQRGAAAGIAINPETPVAAIGDCLAMADLVLVMSVPPGRGGQTFQSAALDKLAQLRNLRTTDRDFLLAIDGGVNLNTIGRCADAGAELFVVGSAILRSEDYTKAVEELGLAAAARRTR